MLLALGGREAAQIAAMLAHSHRQVQVLQPYSPELNPVERVSSYLRSHNLGD